MNEENVKRPPYKLFVNLSSGQGLLGVSWTLEVPADDWDSATPEERDAAVRKAVLDRLKIDYSVG